MKKRILPLFFSLFIFMYGFLSSGCRDIGFFQSLVGVWQCDEIYYVAYQTDNIAEKTKVVISIDGESFRINLRHHVHSKTCYFLKPNSIEDSEGSLFWACDFDLTKNGDLKIKITEDYRYNGTYKGKVFYLKKISDDPQNDSLPESSGQTEDVEREGTSSAI